MLYVLLALVVLFLLIGYVSRAAIRFSTQVIMSERLALARTVAREMDAVFTHLIPELERYARYLHPDAAPPEHRAVMLRGLHEHLVHHQEEGRPRLLELYDARGRVLWSSAAERAPAGSPQSPPAAPGGPGIVAAAVGRVIESGRPFMGTVAPESGRAHPGLLVAVPAPGRGGPPELVLVVDLLPTRSLWRFAGAMADANGSFVLELVTPWGVAAASGPGGLFGSGAHLRLVEPLIAAGRAGVVTHAGVDDTPGGEEVHDHVLAFAPLTAVPWGVLLEQPRDVALSLPRSVERQLLAVGLFALGGGLALAWVTTRQVVRPIESLTRTAQRMAGGDLDRPVDTSAPDEIGILARSFEAMRQELRESRDQIKRWNQALEGRVEARTRELEERNRELVALQSQRTELLRRVIGAQEDERKRVARELHDEVGQFLTGLLLSLGSARQSAEPRAPDVAHQLTGLEDLARRAVEEVRRLVADLRPSVLDDMGLVEAVRWYAGILQERAGLAVEVAARGLDRRLPAHLEVVIFRVVQEALTNVVRHARATRVDIELDAGPLAVRATVRDDGRGFDPTAVAALRNAGSGVGPGLGLLGMEERVRLVGGTFRLESAPGRGTAVAFSIPLKEGDA